MKILVTDGNYKHTLGIIRTLSKQGHLVDCIGTKYCTAKYSKYLNSVAFPQEKFNQYFFQEFIDFLKKSNYDQIIPIGANSINLLSLNRDKLIPLLRIELADHSAIQDCLDKRKTNDLANKLGIPIPRTYSFASAKETLLCENLKYPLVVKSWSEINKIDPIYVQNKYELINAIANYNESNFPIVQQLVRGDGYGFFAFYNNGKLRQYFMHKRVREYPVSGGPSTCAISVYESQIFDYGKRMLDALDWHGVAMVEFKQDSITKEFYLMEINPKFWGSHDLAIACGVDFASPLLDINKFESQNDPVKYTENLIFQWPIDGDIQHAIKRPSNLVQVFSDLINPNVRSNVFFDDLMPSFITLLKKINRILILLPGLSFFYRSMSLGVLLAAVRSLTELTGIPLLKYSQINDGLAVGMQQGRVGLYLLSLKGFNAILNLRSEYDDDLSSYNSILYKKIPVKEYAAPSVDQLQEGALFIKNIISNKGRVYIHCREGVSRAPLFAVAYLISTGSYTVSSAIKEIKAVRPFINILPVQMSILIEFSRSYQNANQ